MVLLDIYLKKGYDLGPCLINMPLVTVLLPFLPLAIGIKVNIIKLCVAYFNLPMYNSCAIVEDHCILKCLIPLMY
ncbi:hypothetical protein GCM10007422_01280 [Pedobacter zeae]|uniref:Uncharacterized protein n=1 Tax=Pedobacter zeae TaxID=1737356 RepID=A0ABQ1XGJ4_9SPHI|nr:hypothetical protein GCM10007422_01280 [Pedobacter zeae]